MKVTLVERGVRSLARGERGGRRDRERRGVQRSRCHDRDFSRSAGATKQHAVHSAGARCREPEVVSSRRQEDLAYESGFHTRSADVFRSPRDGLIGVCAALSRGRGGTDDVARGVEQRIARVARSGSTVEHGRSGGPARRRNVKLGHHHGGGSRSDVRAVRAEHWRSVQCVDVTWRDAFDLNDRSALLN